MVWTPIFIFFSGKTVATGQLIPDRCSVLFVPSDAEIPSAGTLEFSLDQYLFLSWVFLRTGNGYFLGQREEGPGKQYFTYPFDISLGMYSLENTLCGGSFC